MDEIEKFILNMIGEKKQELSALLIDAILRDIVQECFDIMLEKATSEKEFSEQDLFEEVKKKLMENAT